MQNIFFSNFVPNFSGKATACYYLCKYHIIIFIDRMDNFSSSSNKSIMISKLLHPLKKFRKTVIYTSDVKV